VPVVTDGVLRVVFFFSFFGRIVSVLALVRMLPALLAPPGPPSATCGIELTVSVSTVIFLVDPSPDALPLPRPFVVKDLVVGAPLGREAAAGAAEVDHILISPFPPLSLPLSLAGWLAFALIVLVAPLSKGSSFSVTVRSPLCAFSSMPSRVKLFPGVFGWLTSCTVSSVELAPLTPLAGVLMPGIDNESSASLSVACLVSCCSVGCDDR
jgi:hypothetical protein